MVVDTSGDVCVVKLPEYTCVGAFWHPCGVVFEENPQYDALRYTLPERNEPSEVCTGRVTWHIIAPPGSTYFGLHG